MSLGKGDGLPPLRDVVAKFDLHPKRALGQNFIFDLNLTSRIARAAGDLKGVNVLEIGPGPGALTRALLFHGAERVIAIEQDKRCLAALSSYLLPAYPQKLVLLEGDAKKCDPTSEFLKGAPAYVIANLPYNIASKLLVQWLTPHTWPPRFNKFILMFQREVAQRITATPREPKRYSRLSVLCGWRTQAKILFDVPPQAFIPAPKVTSSVVLLSPKPETPCRVEILEKITQSLFSARRKMLRHSLKSWDGAEEALVRLNISGDRRPETLSVDEIIAITNILAPDA